MLEVEASAGYIRANQHSSLIILTCFLKHLTVQLANLTLEQDLLSHSIALLFLASAAFVPVKLLNECDNEISKFTVGNKDNNLFFLVSVQKSQEVNKSVLGWDLRVILLHLLGDRSHHVLLLCLVLLSFLKSYFYVVFH
jgi:hypothetical protein